MVGLNCHLGAFSSCSEQGLLFSWCLGFPSRRLLLLESTGSRAQASAVAVHGLRSLSLLPQWLWLMSLVALQYVGSSQTSVPCIAGRILNHWTTGEALRQGFIGAPPASGLSENKQQIPLFGCSLIGGVSLFLIWGEGGDVSRGRAGGVS